MGGRGKDSGFSGGGSGFGAVFEKYMDKIPQSAYNNRGVSRGVANSIYRAYKNGEIDVPKNFTSYIYNNMVGDSWTTNSRESDAAISLRVASSALIAGDKKGATVALKEFVKREASNMTAQRKEAFLKYING